MIKVSLIVLLLLNVGFQFIYAQKQDTKERYRTWVHPNTDSPTTIRFLYQLKDSSIVLSSSPNQSSFAETFKEINIQDIQTVELRKKDRVGKGVLAGALAGFVTGGLLTLGIVGDCDDCRFSTGGTAFLGGLVFAIPGGLIGGALGSAKIKIPINGNKKTYEKRKRELEKYLIIN